ncbi:MAG TPA: hypothetical protein VG013_25545 [Gemmataceae bacterium]|nr:hypothetical protein [Gemmataceae bacterium]
MTPSPIGKVLSTLKKHRVRALLMGGQACILYGAAEFSRDVDVAVLAGAENLARLRRGLAELRAEPVFFPPLGDDVLRRGHACPFRVHVRGAEDLRLDVMSVLHGCDPFDQLWQRRWRITLPGVGRVNVVSLPDLVRAKKTQRDKHWSMLRRLVEADFHSRSRRPPRAQIEFWLREARTPALLLELCRRYHGTARRLGGLRPTVGFALRGDVAQVEQALQAEEEACRAADRAYWQPLRAELQRWRQNRKRSK